MNTHKRGFYEKYIKLPQDTVLALLALAVLSPVLGLVALAVRLHLGAPVLFRQERAGKDGRSFTLYKFRTMYVQTEEEERKGWTHKDDPRITKIGRFLRKTSLDEFPQLFNVLKGDMSLVGPRPERPQYVEKFREEIPRYMIKHQVRPGLTGWAQVHGRNLASWEEKFAYDVDYVNHVSFALDVKIIFMTVRCVFAREGISAEGSATMEAFTGTSNISEEVR